MRGFLWCHGSMRRGMAKVAWEDVCLPKEEGGLGIRRLGPFNQALVVSHMWKILTLKDSLWVKWIHAYKLRDRNFWDIPMRGNMTWGWRNLLHLRPLIQEFFWYKPGDGSRVYAWFDHWCTLSPLANVISSRDIFRGGFDKQSKVCDLIVNDQFAWPQEWLSKYPSLLSVNVPNLSVGVPDSLVWKNGFGIVKQFSVQTVWNDIRPRGVKVDWYSTVWFSACIPRHALNLWLIVRRRLKTQDKLRAWDHVDWSNLTCALCELQPDSHEHLFFDCVFSQQVWSRVKDLAGLPNSVPSIDDILHDIAPFAKRRTSKSIVAKLVVAAAAYFIWQERNGRLFKESKLSVSQVSDNILNSVRLKLMSCQFKKSRSALEILHRWKISDSII
ncbi:reverse transcriptase zinc-binding domain-containing protein [Tanacetum coccineum]